MQVVHPDFKSKISARDDSEVLARSFVSNKPSLLEKKNADKGSRRMDASATQFLVRTGKLPTHLAFKIALRLSIVLADAVT